MRRKIQVYKAQVWHLYHAGNNRLGQSGRKRKDREHQHVMMDSPLGAFHKVLIVVTDFASVSTSLEICSKKNMNEVISSLAGHRLNVNDALTLRSNFKSVFPHGTYMCCSSSLTAGW